MKPWIAFLFGSSLLVFVTIPVLASATLATPEQDRYAKQAVPPSGKALIYVYRLDDAGPQTATGLWLNKRNSGQLEPRTYGMWAAGPGRLEIRAGQADATPLSITCQAGRIYFVQLTAQADGSMKLRQASYGAGRTEMQQARLVLDPALAARAAATAKNKDPEPEAPAPAKKVQTAKAPPAQRQEQKPKDTPADDDSSEGKSGVTLIFKGGELQAGEQSTDCAWIASQFLSRQSGLWPGR